MQVRKILSKEDIKAKEDRNKLIIGIILAVIMILSSAGYAFYTSEMGNQETEEIVYGSEEIVFKQTDYGKWKFEFPKGTGREFETSFNPLETENISVDITKTISSYYGKLLYFGIDSAEDISQIGINEITGNIGSMLKRADVACLSEDCTENHAIKNCSEENIIVFKELITEDDENNESDEVNETKDSPIASVKEENDCVYIYSSAEDTLKAADAFLFKILGVN